MKKIRLKGFTLIELLITILILALIFSITFIYINETLEKTNNNNIVITKTSILEAADIFVTENLEELVWQKDNTSCITIKELVNNGFFKSNDIEENGFNDYSIKVIEEQPKVYTYELINELYCNFKFLIEPSITIENDIKKYRYENFDLWSDVLVEGEEIVEKKIIVNDNNIINTNELDVGNYIANYYVKNIRGDEVSADRKIEIMSTKKEYECTEQEEEYVIPVSGYYSIIANGSQGSNNGGLGGKVYGKTYFQKDETLKINVGCTNGYNGGGINEYSSGGGATTIQNNSEYILIAGGGGGSLSSNVSSLTEKSQGGAGDGTGAVNGTNGGGGASSNWSMEYDGEECISIPNPDFKCESEPDEIQVICKQYKESCYTPPKYCTQYGNGKVCIMGNICYPTFDCIAWSDTTPQCYPNPQAGCAVEETIVWPGAVTCNSPLTESCYPKYDIYNGIPGNGGQSSVVNKNKDDFGFMSGQQEGNGNLSIEFAGEVK